MRVGVLWMLMIMMLACYGCYANPYVRPAPRVFLAQTPEAQACSRQCEQLFETCYAGCAKPLIALGHPCGNRCGESWQNCLASCPGAAPAK